MLHEHMIFLYILNLLANLHEVFFIAEMKRGTKLSYSDTYFQISSGKFRLSIVKMPRHLLVKASHYVNLNKNILCLHHSRYLACLVTLYVSLLD